MPPPPTSSRSRLVPIVLAQAIGFLCGIASIKLNSHLIPPAMLGVYGVFLTFTPIGMWVVYAGLMRFVSRNWAAAASRGELSRDVLSVWRRRLPWLAVFVALASPVIAPFGQVGALFVGLALFFSAAFLSLGALAQSALQAEGAHWRDCVVAAGASLTRSLVPPLLFAATGGAASALLLGFSAHALVVAGAGAWAVSAAFHDARPGEGKLPAVYGGLLFTILAFSGWLLAGLNRWLVVWFYGDVEAGYFTLMGGAAVIVTSMLGTVMMQYLQPGLFALGDGPADVRRTLARRTDLAALVYTGLALLALAGLHALAPLLIGWLISPDYRHALVWLFPAGCFGAAMITNTIYHIMLIAGRRERACGPVELAAAAVLTAGCVISAAAGPIWLARWLMVTPVIPWILTRPLARHYFFKPAEAPAPAPAR